MGIEDDFRRLFTNAQFMTKDHVRFVRQLLDELIRTKHEVSRLRAGGGAAKTSVPSTAPLPSPATNPAQVIKMRDEVKRLTDEIIRLKAEEKKFKDRAGEFESDLQRLNKEIRAKEKELVRVEARHEALSGNLLVAVENAIDALKQQGVTTRKKKTSPAVDGGTVAVVVPDPVPAAPAAPTLDLQALRERAQETQQLQQTLRSWSAPESPIALDDKVPTSDATGMEQQWWESLDENQQKVVAYVRDQQFLDYPALLSWAVQEHIMLDGTILMLNDACDAYGLPHAIEANADEGTVHAAAFLSHPFFASAA